MLHEVPDSPFRDRLLEVVEMQRTLISGLCALPEGTVVEMAWLAAQWPGIDEAWLRRFWENDNGTRASCCRTIAAASQPLKQELMGLMKEQMRFPELYADPPGLRLTAQSWTVGKKSTGAEKTRQAALAATRCLMEAFYAPLFYSREGYPNADGSRFHKDQFTGRPKVCPYSDNAIQDVKLDHFLPKETFPFLSCHPDNLIPCSTDPNSVGRKGNIVPLQTDAAVQAAEWFHPRLRPARGRYRLVFENASALSPQVRFEALHPADQPRLDRMAGMFGLVDFWSRDLDDELQFISGEVRDDLFYGNEPLTDDAVRRSLQRKAAQKRRRIGHDAKAIVTAAFYEWILATPSLFAQVLRTCEGGTRKPKTKD